MQRKRITQVFPFLLPIRKKQRYFCFYTKMLFDRNIYAKELAPATFEHLQYQDKSLLINTNTGFDIEYQKNKVHNLKLAAATINGILIAPGETLSFWKLVRHAEKKGKYLDGLTVIDGQVKAESGGGLCQLSNMLFWLALHTPLSIAERHPHVKKDFPAPPDGAPDGTDATVSEGWLDLKIKNNTNSTYQILIDFDENYMYGKICSSNRAAHGFSIECKNLKYTKSCGKTYQSCSIYRKEINAHTGEILSERLLYNNLCEIGYEIDCQSEDILGKECNL